MSAADRRAGARERLISAAIVEIAERGYEATAVADVVSRASCARDAFYENFRDREDCLLVAVDRVAGELLAKLRRATRGAHGADAARSLVSALVGYACEDPAPARLLLLEALGGGPRALARRDRLVAEVEELIEDSSQPARRGDRRVLALPSAALVGGTVRLLTVRLQRDATDEEELRSGLLAWIDTYLTPAGRSASTRERFPLIEPPENLALSSMSAPLPVPRGRHGGRPSEVARNQRERILHATLQAVYQYTYPATTVQDIVAYAGVSRRAFYRHFRDREHAATEANELFFEHVLATCAAAYFAASGWPRRIWAAGRTLTSFFAANPAVARSGFVEFHAVSPAAIQHVYDRVWAFTLFLEEGYSCREQNRELPRLCSEALAAVMFEFAYRAARRHPAAAELPTMLPVFAYVCVAPFLGPDAATDFVQTMTKGAAIRQRGSRR